MSDQATRVQVLALAKNAMTHDEIRSAILTARLFLEVHPEDKEIRDAVTELFDRGIALATARQFAREDSSGR